MAEKVLWNADKLNLSIGRQTIFKDASMSLATEERVALVGRNGCGKSTLLKIIAGLERPSSGEISVARNTRIAYMPQDFDLTSDKTVSAVVREGLAWFEELQHRYGTISQNSPEHAQIEQFLTFHNAWNLENKLAAVMDKLSLPDDSKTFDTLSGGERRRVLLARTIIAEPELLLLDEPTNHLDVNTITWIEEFLASYRGTCFFVTHDRYFLDRIATRIIELDHGSFFSCAGSYADFLEAKAEREYAEDLEAEKRSKFLRLEVEWVRRSPKARLKRNLGRMKRYYELAAVEGPQRTDNVELVIPSPSRLGNKVVALKDVSLSLGNRKLLEHFDYEFTAKHKVGIVGANGTGKTSLLKLITGELAPDSGAVEVAETVRFNYVDQSRVALNPELTVCEEISGDSEFINLGDERISIWGYLKRFLFEDERINTKVKYLSGGEKARLMLAKILKNGGNFLILDEPTNDLDLSSLRILEEALIHYDSSLIVVSHDRYFLNRVCNYVIAFEDAAATPQTSIGDYDYYLAKKKERAVSVAESEMQVPSRKNSAPPSDARKNPAKKLSYMEERELSLLDTKIPEAESKVSEIEAVFADPDFFTSRAKDAPQVQRELEEAKAELERLYARWEELENKKEALSASNNLKG